MLSNFCEKIVSVTATLQKTFFSFYLVLFFFFNKIIIFPPLGRNERCLKLQVKIAGLQRHWRLKLISLGNYKCNLSHAALSFSFFSPKSPHNFRNNTVSFIILTYETLETKWPYDEQPFIPAVSLSFSHVNMQEKSVCWKVFVPRKKIGAPSYFIVISRFIRLQWGGSLELVMSLHRKQHFHGSLIY